MRRQLSVRERMLLILLIIVMLVSGYVMLFRRPMISEQERCAAEIESYRDMILATELRVAEKQRMERELEKLLSSENPPKGIASYDNLQPVMFELNGILQSAESYSLTFGTVDTEQTIVRRQIALTFTVKDYTAAKAILRQLHDSQFRCLLDNISISTGKEETSVTGTIVFFEYQEKGS